LSSTNATRHVFLDLQLTQWQAPSILTAPDLAKIDPKAGEPIGKYSRKEAATSTKPGSTKTGGLFVAATFRRGDAHGIQQFDFS
jgi:hypothetical protein